MIMLIMNARGADKLLSDKFTIGGEASVAECSIRLDFQMVNDSP